MVLVPETMTENYRVIKKFTGHINGQKLSFNQISTSSIELLSLWHILTYTQFVEVTDTVWEIINE